MAEFFFFSAPNLGPVFHQKARQDLVGLRCDVWRANLSVALAQQKIPVGKNLGT